MNLQDVLVSSALSLSPCTLKGDVEDGRGETAPLSGGVEAITACAVVVPIFSRVVPRRKYRIARS